MLVFFQGRHNPGSFFFYGVCRTGIEVASAEARLFIFLELPFFFSPVMDDVGFLLVQGQAKSVFQVIAEPQSPSPLS